MQFNPYAAGANYIRFLTFVFAHCLSSLNPYSAGIDFSRQNLTSADVRF